MNPKISIVEGPRKTIADFYSNFTKSEIQLLVGSNQSTNNTASIEYPNIKMVNFNMKNILPFDPASIISKSPNNLSWKYFPKINNFLKSSDIIGISDTYYFWNYQAFKFAKKNNIPLFTIIWCNMKNHPSIYIPPYSFISNEIAKYSSLFILRNKACLKFTRSLNIPDEKTKIIYMGIDLEHFVPKNYNLNSTATVKILFVGSLTPSKGVLDLLKAFTILHSTHPNIELLIAGSGPLENKIKELSQKYPIKYLGFTPYEKLPDFYTQCDIFCSPSKTLKYFNFPINQEYFPYTSLEAMASALPIISTNIGGIPEAIGQDNLLVHEGDIEQLVNSLKLLINNKTLRQEIGQKNRERAKKLFDSKVQVRETEEAILNIKR
ncbi:MAG: glycosyltransferase family 4 protein [bacterium]|nr:glycosyltransferase family 4 protein [bacterium]